MIQERSGVAAEGTGAGGNVSGAGASSPSYRHPLRHYQQRAVTMVSALLTRAGLRLLMYAPTGAGKTRVLAELCRLAAAQGLRVLVIAPRKEIVSQTWRTIVDNLDPLVDGVSDKDVGVIMGANVSGLDAAADKALRRPGARVQVATVQTFSARRKSSGFVPDVIIVDEAHHAHEKAESYVGILASFANAAVIGATATPWTPDERSLKGTFHQIEVLATVKQLLAEGILAEPLVYTHADARELGLKDVAVVGGDFAEGDGDRSLGALMSRPKLVGNIVSHYLERVVAVRGRAVPTLSFAASVEHSKSIVARFCEAGMHAVHLDGDTPQVERDRILEALKAGEVDIVSNYGVLTEGFDAPGVECIILARPTLRPHVYRQAVGRGMRKVAGSDKVVTVLDHAGLARAFGHPGEDVPASLDDDPRCGPGRGAEWKAPTKECVACGATVAATRAACPCCGGKASEGREVGGLLEVDGSLVEMVRGRDARGDGMERRAFRGEMRTVREVHEITGISVNTLKQWFAKDLDVDMAVASYAPAEAKRVTFRGEMRTVREVHEITGISVNTLKRWLKKDLDFDAEVAQHRSLAPRSGAPQSEVRHQAISQTRDEAGDFAATSGVPIGTVRWWIRMGYDLKARAASYKPARSQAPRRAMYRGVMCTAYEVSRVTGIPEPTIHHWIHRGAHCLDEAVSAHKPATDTNKREFLGEVQSARSVAEATGADATTVRRWFRSNARVEDAASAYLARKHLDGAGGSR